MFLTNSASARLRGGVLGWWTIDSGDTRIPKPDAARAARLVRESGGGVVLLHDCDRKPETNEFVLRATEILLAQAKEEGLSVMSLGEFLELEQRER